MHQLRWILFWIFFILSLVWLGTSSFHYLVPRPTESWTAIPMLTTVLLGSVTISVLLAMFLANGAALLIGRLIRDYLPEHTRRRFYSDNN